ncbi:DUF423 domain-containing protein [Suttonella ornithocola]|uniref:Protein of uncharacterized function (DUF423) n=1 Tax=Suttonella ornithocola TaxID=279832 RepID=A0A380MXK3_9GAMM|nr:DUF423 domain-containing protein [Suttonella ornithocola]SUO97008.1 Protein of uncharacterised function (DUF423) [Suttonella ornithocola]
MKRWLIVAAIGGFLWVTLGAATGHGVLLGQEATWFEKAQRYHIVHVLALLWLAATQTSRFLWVAYFWVAGVVCFSGSLYLMSLVTGWSSLRFITPIGGVCFLLGWAVLMGLLWREGRK